MGSHLIDTELRAETAVQKKEVWAAACLYQHYRPVAPKA
jgi:hypothetical protein